LDQKEGGFRSSSSMIQLGTPFLFCTLSAADNHWPELQILLDCENNVN